MVYSTATAAVIADIVRQCQPQIDAFATDMLEYVYALVYAERDDTIDPENVNWRPKGGRKKPGDVFSPVIIMVIYCMRF